MSASVPMAFAGPGPLTPLKPFRAMDAGLGLVPLAALPRPRPALAPPPPWGAAPPPTPSRGPPPLPARAAPAASPVLSAASSAPSAGAGLGDQASEEDAELLWIWRQIDRGGSPHGVSKLGLITAMQREPAVAAFVLPGLSGGGSPLDSDEGFEAAEELFHSVARGRARMRWADFLAHFRTAAPPPGAPELRSIYDLVDSAGSGSVSKRELLGAVQKHPAVARLFLPLGHGGSVLSDQSSFDAVIGTFEAISCGRKRFDYRDFEAHFHATRAVPFQPVPDPVLLRSRRRIFILGPGFGRELNPAQGAMIERAGYQVYWCTSVPNPEVPNFSLPPYLARIRAEIDHFRPDVVAAASKGGVYMVGLWQAGYWRGPSLLLNAHPACRALPKGVPVVLAAGSNDEVYPTSRAQVESLVSTGSENMRFLYYTSDSGRLPCGSLTRVGDRHNMESMLEYDTLPRLIDATLCPEGPEVHMVRSWRDRLSRERVEAEAWLGYSPERLRRLWSSAGRQGTDERRLFEVPFDSPEFRRVAAVFRATPREPPAYVFTPQHSWDATRLLRVQRIENGLQTEGASKPYYEAMARSVQDQGLEFEPGVHTCWAFHGADVDAIDSIIHNPMAGFQPCASRANSSLWGSGSYFARDGKYVADGGFCGAASNGTRQMLMCLLTVGLPCLGSPEHRGVLPFRQRPHRYTSSVDSLSSPEVYVVQHPGAAHPAYVLTFG